MKKLLALLLAVLMLASFVACGSDDPSEGGNAAVPGIVIKNDDSVAMGAPATQLNPADVYAKLTYTPQMFYGEYRLKGGDTAIEQYEKDMSYIDIDAEYFDKITAIPHALEVGPHTLGHYITRIEEHNWLRAHFQNDAGNLYNTLCSYVIEGNKIKLTPVDEFNVDKENNKITYSMQDVVWEYEFKFAGVDLTLSAGGKSVTLSTGLDVYEDTDYFYAEHYLSPGSDAIDGIDEIGFLYNAEDGEYNRFYVEHTELDYASFDQTAIGTLNKNGLLTFTVPWSTGTKTYQYVFFYGHDDGLVLTDGDKVYYYNDTYNDRTSIKLENFLTEDQTGKLDNMSDSQLDAIVEKKENLMDDLAKAFNDAGITVSVDQTSGEMAMDSSILFGGDSAVLSAEGKAFLNKFINAYTSIVYNDKYNGFVAKTMVEGHTAPLANSTYESGLPLSQERAANVKAYCLSAENGISAEYITALSTTLEDIGYSNSRPIKDADGNVNKAASRRVSFRFIINLD